MRRLALGALACGSPGVEPADPPVPEAPPIVVADATDGREPLGAVRFRGVSDAGDLVELLVDRVAGIVTRVVVHSPRGPVSPLAAPLEVGADGGLLVGDPAIPALLVRGESVAAALVELHGVVRVVVAVADSGSRRRALLGTWAYVDRWCVDAEPCDGPFPATIGSVRFADDGRWRDCKAGFVGPRLSDCPTSPLPATGTWAWGDDGRARVWFALTDELVGRASVSGAGLLVATIEDQPASDEGPGVLLGAPEVPLGDVGLDGTWDVLRDDGTQRVVVVAGGRWRDGDTDAPLVPDVPRPGFLTVDGVAVGVVAPNLGVWLGIPDASVADGWLEVGLRR